MVLGANMELYGGGRWRKITSVKTSYSENYGNYLLFDVTVVSPPTKRVPTYGFSTRLSTPNYAPVAPLPDTTINSEFELELKLRFAWESTDLVNKGYGRIKIPYYLIRLGRGIAFFSLRVEISDTNVSLNHRNFITQLPMPMPAPVSVLF